MVKNTSHIIRIREEQLQLGEGPVWDWRSKRVYYVDITAKNIWYYDSMTKENVMLAAQDMVGCLVLDKEGNLIMAEKDTLVQLNPRTGERNCLCHLDIDQRFRFNDGKCDCKGRLWVGTMAMDQSSADAVGGGALYRISADLKAVKVLDQMTIPNGLAFSENNQILYHIDTHSNCIRSYQFDADTGALSSEQIVVKIPQEEGSPDGMTIDSSGMLWVALWGGGQVAQYDPATGEKLYAIDLPDKNVSCCTFGGSDRDLLYITSAMDEEGRGGYLYEVKVPARGMLPFLWGNDAPEIPLIPTEIPQMQQHLLCLDGEAGSGWEFLMEPSLEVPCPDAPNQDFDFSKWNTKSWKPVIVPGELVMQGFSIKNNTEYYYRRRVDIPMDFAEKRVLIRFDGVYSNARVWIGDAFIRNHCGGFTTWDCDITAYVIPGASLILTVGVADLEGNDRGNYNPSGISKRRNPAWASFYAHHNIGGILRSVSLLALPEIHLVRLYTETTFDDTFTDAVLTMDIVLQKGSRAALLRYQLLDQNKVSVAQGSTEFSATQNYARLRQPVKEPQKWDAEHPNLYTLLLSVESNEIVYASYQENIGFRQIQFAGQNGTDSNKIYVNGKDIKLRGTCRHDVSFHLGRSTSREEDWAEIKAYKEANINHVRTSHYPASRHFLDACDALGMYVEQENAACFQGDNGYDIHSEPSDFVGQFTEMIERDRNRPCILIWSLGNESGFEKTAAFRQELDYVRSADTSRPVIFSYPFTVESLPLPYDIFSIHYDDVYNPKGSLEVPVLHDEYMHIACYNNEELKRDPNVRNFWGNGLKMAWENILQTEGALGGDLWGGIDDVFYLPYASDELWQSHSDGKAAGYGQWGSVLDVHRRLKPEAYLTKKAYSPIRVDEKAAVICQNELFIPVANWFDHTNLEEIRLSWNINGKKEQKNIKLPSVAPHKKGMIQLQGEWDKANTVSLRFYDAGGFLIDEYLLNLNSSEERAQLPAVSQPKILETKTEIIIEAGDTRYQFDKVAACLRSAVHKDSLLLTGGPCLHISGMTLGTWKADKCGATAALENDRAVVTLFGSCGEETRVCFMIYIYGNGRMFTRCVVGEIDGEGKAIGEVGISYRIPTDVDAVSWNRQGLYSCYPEDHIGRTSGTAYRCRQGAEKEDYGTIPSWPWKDDMRDDFLYAGNDPKNGLATRDFQAMRENIYSYRVHFAGRESYLQAESDGKAAARVQITVQPAGGEELHLVVNSRWSYPGLAWGNFMGEPITLFKGFAVEAVLVLA